MTTNEHISRYGALPDRTLLEMIDSGFIKGASLDNVNPASLDLSLSDEVYEVEAIFQPLPGETIKELLSHLKYQKHDLVKPLEKDKVYLARLNESVNLPHNVYGYCNPKSTTGRNDTHVRVIADGVSRYDTVPTGAGKTLDLWIIINPKSYAIVLSAGQPLSQLRLFNRDTRFTETDLEIFLGREALAYDRSGKALSYQDLKITDHDGSIILTLDLDSQVVGYECLADISTSVDFTKINHHQAEDFFKALPGGQNDLISLKKDRFYLLSTAEAVCVPETLACEMVPMDERSGEFRSHYAGFIDPGWGMAGRGKGRPLTLEVRPFEDMVIRRGQPIAKIKFERVAGLPDRHYDAVETSNYVKQAMVGLPKQFKK